MAVDGFNRLYHDADARTKPARVAVAGGDDPTVLEAMRIACDCGWVQPVLFGSERGIKTVADVERDRPRRLRDPPCRGSRNRRGGGGRGSLRSCAGTHERATLHARADEGRPRSTTTDCGPVGSSARSS